ncbi:hypothetical protein DM02DRAFT_525630, partial [Periconia macrospinosa]
QYLKYPILSFYYNEIKKPGSMESDVDNFYLNFLQVYFPVHEDYGIEHESRPLEEQGFKKRTDFTIRYIKNDHPTKIILLEDKRAGKETSTEQWKKALAQVAKYADMVRKEKKQDPDETIYLTVNIGTFIRLLVGFRNKGATLGVKNA